MTNTTNPSLNEINYRENVSYKFENVSPTTALFCGRAIKYEQTLNPTSVTIDDLWNILKKEEQALGELYQKSGVQFKFMNPFELNVSFTDKTPFQQLVQRIIVITEHQHFLLNQAQTTCKGCTVEDEDRTGSKNETEEKVAADVANAVNAVVVAAVAVPIIVTAGIIVATTAVATAGVVVATGVAVAVTAVAVPIIVTAAIIAPVVIPVFFFASFLNT